MVFRGRRLVKKQPMVSSVEPGGRGPGGLGVGRGLHPGRTAPGRSRPSLHSHHLQDLAGLEGRAWQQNDRTAYVARLDAHHVRILVVSKVGDIFRLVHPRVPNNRVGEVILLDPHLPPRHHVSDDVLLRCILVYPVRPFTYRHNIPPLLVHGAVSSLQNKTFVTELRRLILEQ